MNESRFGLWWPDFEAAHETTEDYIINRVTDIDRAVSHVRTKGIAVQAGGHVGLFPRHLARQFTFVLTFEPSPEMFECLHMNTVDYPNILAHECALGAKQMVTAFQNRVSGRSCITPTGDFNVSVATIDSYHLPRCDLLYLDLEGYELNALDGAVETIKNFRPVITVEVLKGREKDINNWFSAHRYERAERIHSDWTFVPL